MSGTTITFDDGAAYEEFMGVWSRQVGGRFLAWLAASPGLRWVDVGCGNGCFTEQLCQQAAPAAVEAVDPSAGQLAHAGSLLRDLPVRLRQGDAMALPFDDRVFDAAVMALVIFFVPDPARGLAEMIRVTRPGGLVSAYAWDVPGGGFPWAAIGQARTSLGLPAPGPPSAAISAMDALEGLWRGGGLAEMETMRFDVEREFADFDAYWATAKRGPNGASLASGQEGELRDRARAFLGCPATGSFKVRAFANAVRGRVPG